MSIIDRECTRRSVLAGSGALLLATIAGCSAKGGSPSPAGTASTTGAARSAQITFANPETDPADLAFIEAAVKAFRDEYGVDVELATIAQDSFQQVVNSIKSGNAYDLAAGVCGTASYLAASDLLYPLDHIVDALGGSSAFVAAALYPVNGKNYFIPYNGLSNMQYIRTDWLNDVGEQMPTTWDEFRTVARKFTEAGHFGWSIPMTAGAIANTQGSDLLWSNRVSFFDDDFNVILGEGENLERCSQCLEFLLSMKEYIPESMIGVDYGGLTNTFYEGTSGIVPYVGRISGKILAEYPDLLKNFAVTGFPTPEGDGDPAVTFESDNFYIPASADGAADAAEFLGFFLQNYYVDFLLNDAMQRQPMLKSVYEDPTWLDDEVISALSFVAMEQKKMLDADGYYVGGLNSMPCGPGVLPTVTANNFVIGNMYQNVMVGGMTPDAATRAAADQIRDLAAGL